jgi:hypothetical protein
MRQWTQLDWIGLAYLIVGGAIMLLITIYMPM